jgi:hypothetical protein
VVVESSEESNLLKGKVDRFQKRSNEGQTASGHKRRFESTITADTDAKGVNEAVSNNLGYKMTDNGAHETTLGSGDASYFYVFGHLPHTTTKEARPSQIPSSHEE